MDIVVWLRSLGLEEYEEAFRDNKITSGSSVRVKLRNFDPRPLFHKRVKDRPLLLDLSGLCEAPRTPTPPWTPSLPQPMICATHD